MKHLLGLFLFILLLLPPRLHAQSRLQPENFEYLGAFRLPDGGERPLTFDYGGNAMTFNSAAGSLFIMGHDRMPYGELPNGNQIAEVSIPTPVIAEDVNALPQAEFLRDFQDVTQGYFVGLDEIPRVGMLYLDTPATGLYLAWGQHLQDDISPSHAWFSLDDSVMYGPWYLDDLSPYSTTGYMLEIPAAWAAEHVQGRIVGTGRFRDGGWSGMGPSLIAYQPWIDDNGTPAPAESHLDAVPLLLYASSQDTDDVLERSMNGYQHPDEWEGAAWIETDAAAAVLFAGTKSVGDKYWYGFANADGPEYPCIQEDMIGEFTLCRLADGSPCPPEDLHGCETPTGRGWWSTRFEAQFILYDPADLARVAAGELAPWEPQPYASLTLDSYLFLNASDSEGLGSGVQRRARIGDVAYDRAHNLLYVLELYADGARPVVHVWQIQP